MKDARYNPNPDFSQRKLFWHPFTLYTLDILVPKKRGTGFLRQPVGHHVSPLFSFIEYDLGFTCCGLDGYLAIEVRSHAMTFEECEAIVKKVGAFMQLEHEAISYEAFDKMIRK